MSGIYSLYQPLKEEDQMDKRIVGVYNNGDEAVQAIEELKSQGYDRDSISVIAKDRDDVEDIHEETGTKTEEGMATGAATGGVLGGLAGFLAGVGALAIPGVGPILAAGPIAATLTGAAVGAGAGGLAGALIGMGIPEDEANRYESDVKAGKILVLVDEEGRGFNTTDGSVTRNSNDWSGSTTMDDPNLRHRNEFGSGTVDANHDTLGGNLHSPDDTTRKNQGPMNSSDTSTSGLLHGGATMGGSRQTDTGDTGMMNGFEGGLNTGGSLQNNQHHDYGTGGSGDNKFLGSNTSLDNADTGTSDPSAINQNTAGAAFGTDDNTIIGGTGGPGGNSTVGKNERFDVDHNNELNSDPSLNTPNAQLGENYGDSLVSNDPFRGTDDTLRETNKNRDSFDDRFKGEGRDSSKR